ncbi:MAG TPA: DUF1549 and DUF1553 domain-containing protein [Caulifigura sp.]|nr:DUF1549 and DUF1553 domain-containing protein [Caulifigura sp.]
MTSETRDDLFRLLEALCEERLEEADAARLESLVLQNPDARRMFVDYLSLHGLLHWDAAPEAESLDIEAILKSGPQPASTSAPSRRAAILRALVSTAAALLVLVGAYFASRNHQPLPAVPGPDQLANETPVPAPADATDLPKIVLSQPERPSTNPGPESSAAPENLPDVNSGDVVARLDRLMEQAWRDGGVTPSGPADDAEWIRRVSLDLCGRIPELAETEQFVADRSPDKRARAIDRLLSDPAYARHFSTVWTNLLVGRTPPRKIDRDGLAKFLRDQFWNDRPWSETVTDLIAAEGSEKDNGAANYLLAHLNNQAVPATAITARLFLCQQVQCAQCHIHPIVKDWGQEQFWQLNAFFQGTKLVEKSKQLDDGRRVSTKELVSQPADGPIYFETLNGVMRVAYPSFDGKEIPPEKSTSRRKELARLMSEGENPQLASAFVNRLWAQMFGRGFTTPLDDMGPHNPPTHPEVLDLLTREFVKSDYNVRELLRWMCSSKLYQLSSRTAPGNDVDDPESGSPPMFTRMYVKPLSAEQLFDSLLVATNADHTAAVGRDAEMRRESWLAQFYSAIDNDENTEQTTFDGSLPQALVMMNGDLVKEAVSGRPGTFLNKVESLNAPDAAKLERLSMAILARKPTPLEQKVFEQALKPQSKPTRTAAAAPTADDTLRDACWAYLNSTEFVVNR